MGAARPRGHLWKLGGQFFPSSFRNVHMDRGSFCFNLFLCSGALWIWFVSALPRLLFWAGQQNDVMGSLKVYGKSSKPNDFNILYSVDPGCWLAMETTPRRPGGGSHRIKASLLSTHRSIIPPPPPNPSPPSQGLGQKPSPEERREARGIGGQREFPQKNGDTGLSGEPEVTFTDLWVIVRLAALPVMAMSPERAKWQQPQGTSLNL